MPKDRDAAGKDLIETRPIDWLAMAGLPVPAEPSAVVVVDAELSTVTTAADKLILVDRPGGPYVAHIEVQSTPDDRLDYRIGVYNAFARQRHRPPVFSVVFLLSRAAARGVTGRVVERLANDVRLDFAYRRIRVWELSTEAVLSGPLGTLPLAPLTAVNRRGLPAVIDRMAGRLAAEVSPADARQLWASTAILFGLRYKRPVVEAMMQSVTQMRESSIWQMIHGEGRDEGLIAGRVATLVDQGSDKFGPPPTAVANRIAVLTDVETLRRLARRVLTAASWDELMADA